MTGNLFYRMQLNINVKVNFCERELIKEKLLEKQINFVREKSENHINF